MIKANYTFISVFLLVFIVTNVSADQATPGSFGEGIISILRNSDLSQLTIATDETPTQIQDTLISPESVEPSAVIQLSDIIGLYDLVSCTVNSVSLGNYTCADLGSFTGDMAITPNSTMWQRVSVSGLQPFVASGLFSLNNNTITAVNDSGAGTSVLSLSWNGDLLVTQITTIDVTETDVWRKVAAPVTTCPTPSDGDKDGVINQWDNCSGTPAGSCVDKTGCPVDIPRCVNMAPINNLLLDESN